MLPLFISAVYKTVINKIINKDYFIRASWMFFWNLLSQTVKRTEVCLWWTTKLFVQPPDGKMQYFLMNIHWISDITTRSCSVCLTFKYVWPMFKLFIMPKVDITSCIAWAQPDDVHVAKLEIIGFNIFTTAWGGAWLSSFLAMGLVKFKTYDWRMILLGNEMTRWRIPVF